MRRLLVTGDRDVSPKLSIDERLHQILIVIDGNAYCLYAICIVESRHFLLKVRELHTDTQALRQFYSSVGFSYEERTSVFFVWTRYIFPGMLQLISPHRIDLTCPVRQARLRRHCNPETRSFLQKTMFGFVAVRGRRDRSSVGTRQADDSSPSIVRFNANDSPRRQLSPTKKWRRPRY